MKFINENKISGLPVIQNQQEFVIGIFTIGQIFKFTRFTRRLIVEYDEDNMPIYNPHIQRTVENSRVEKIADFLINDPDAIFPTNVVFCIPSQAIEKQTTNSPFVEIYLAEKVFTELKKEAEKSDTFITIIDGQHRIRGIEVAIGRLNAHITALQKTVQGSTGSNDLEKKLEYFYQRLEDLLNIQLVVSFFIDKTIEYQAMIFSTINRTQKKVSESLVYSLFGLTTNDSPQKTALQIVLTLNANSKSPFFNRIKLYGGEYEKNQSPPLSQAGMVKSIVNLISENIREAENDRFKDRKELSKRSPGSNRNLPFRKYYALNEDTKISDIFYYFFRAVRETFIDSEGGHYWDFNPETMTPTNILHTTVGYQALLELLIDILDKLPEAERFSVDSYKSYLTKAKNLSFGDTQRYAFTSRSKSIFYLDLSIAIWPPTDPIHDKRVIKLKELLERRNP